MTNKHGRIKLSNGTRHALRSNSVGTLPQEHSVNKAPSNNIVDIWMRRLRQAQPERSIAHGWRAFLICVSTSLALTGIGVPGP